MVALAFTKDKEKKLEWIGVKDSKLLSPQVREELFERIYELVDDFRVEVIEPDAIDKGLQESNLNWVEADTTARLIADLNPDTAIIDCPSVNIPAYTAYLLNKLPDTFKQKELIVEHKADVHYVIVSASSVIAKVIRDRYITRLQREIGIDFGSGYLSDPKTQAFLKEHYNAYANLFRKSWQPYQNILRKKEQKSLDDFPV